MDTTLRKCRYSVLGFIRVTAHTAYFFLFWKNIISNFSSSDALLPHRGYRHTDHWLVGMGLQLCLTPIFTP